MSKQLIAWESLFVIPICAACDAGLSTEEAAAVEAQQPYQPRRFKEAIPHYKHALAAESSEYFKLSKILAAIVPNRRGIISPI